MPADGPASLLADDSPGERLKNLLFHYRLGPRHLYAPPGGRTLFTDNETNGPAVFGPGAASRSPYTKDALQRHVIHGEDTAVNPDHPGTKACLHYQAEVAAGGSRVWHLCLTPERLEAPLGDVEAVVDARRREADEFYAAIHPPKATADERLVQRQALASMLWTKQTYLFDVGLWLDGDNPAWPPPESARGSGTRPGRT